MNSRNQAGFAAGMIAMIMNAGLAAGQAASPGDELLPPGAKAGECYTRIFVPASYQTESSQVLAREASAKVEVIPAQYENVEDRVLVKEASTRLEVIPAKYETVEERVLIKEASSRLEAVPATYEWVDEKILVKPAHTIWKEGRGPIEKVSNATGEIMCLVEVPAEYDTVRKKVIKTPATTRTIEIPAEYTTVKRRVTKTPATTRTIEIPAEYKTVKIRKMVKAPQERKVEIPAQYTSVSQRKLVKEGRMEWRQILCQTNIRPDTIVSLQRSLKKIGHDPGPIDGVVGGETMRAVHSFQTAKGLPQGGLTIATINALGVDLSR